ncbi:MAG: Clp1/GlmU family protein [Desulfobacterales bacterium]
MPDVWRKLPFRQMRGTIMVLGETDTGKSTFCRWLVDRLAERCLTAWLDCDIGQSSLGAPSTMNLGIAETNAALHLAASFFRRKHFACISGRPEPGHLPRRICRFSGCKKQRSIGWQGYWEVQVYWSVSV